MPSFALHMLLAAHAVDEWRLEPAGAPFDPFDPEATNALFNGANAPDMGRYPGGDELLSDVVHRLRTGRLTRALIAAARSDVERAFAWGWLTHVLADAELHPLVDQVAAESLGWDAPRLGTSEQQFGHVRVEMGLDSEYIRRYPFLSRLRLRTALGARSVGFVQSAFLDTYGVRLDTGAILRSHSAMVRFHSCPPPMGRRAGRRRGVSGTAPALLAIHPVLRVARWVSAHRPASPVAGFLDPLMPEPNLVRRVDAFISELPRIVRRYQTTRLATLPDLDLETGEVERPAAPTPGAVAAMRGLAERGLILDGHAAGEAA